MNQTVFPYYCQLVNEKAFYYIESEQKVFEVQIVGKKTFYFERKITILPDRIWLKDVIDDQITYPKIKKEVWLEKLALVGR